METNMKINVMPSHEVAYLLRKELGPIRAWDDCLADMRRERALVNGYTLLPECRSKGGSAWRPMYQVSKVVAFIKAVRAVDPNATRNEPPQIKTAIMDPADCRHWKLRKLPVAISTFVSPRAVAGAGSLSA
jgi:hypothetical protein